MRQIIAVMILMLPAAAFSRELARITVQQIESQNVPAGYIEFAGISAGPFNPKIWQDGRLHILPEHQSPILPPREGKFRNIYAPSPVEIEGGWRVFYGAWDGVPTGNDRIYSAFTSDFLTFSDRHTVIEHGPFEHVCNVSATRLP